MNLATLALMLCGAGISAPFDLGTGQWTINWPGRVAKHDLVYQTPPWDPMQGIPLGNGDVGALCWCEGSRLVIAVNKCDLWDDGKPGPFHNWSNAEEEHSTTQRHACRLILDFQQPIFDAFYLEQFEGRLAISNGLLTMKSRTPFGVVELSVFVDYSSGVIVCNVDNQLTERAPITVTLERYGSRTFSHWYAVVNRDPKLGLEGTEAAVDGNAAFITQKLHGSGDFAVGCKVAARDGLDIAASRRHSRAADLSVASKTGGRFTLSTAVTSPGEKDPIAAAKAKLSRAEKLGSPKLLDETSRAWRAFWEKSLMESGDDYLDNLWHLTMYYGNASQRGPFPGRFINGLWGWSRDVQNWNFYFHWNQQQIYWPLNAAGHSELCDAYLNYRFNSLPHAKKDAATTFHADGAVVSDVCDRRGYNSASEFRNHTPVAQIAMEFWRQYQYTRDKTFLRNKALPYLIEASKFFESLFDKESDGKYHARSGTGYEGWIDLHDSITELASAKTLFAATLAAIQEARVDEPRAAKWRDILEKMMPLPVIKLDENIARADNGAIGIRRGLFRGTSIPTDQAFAAGFLIRDKRLASSIIPVGAAKSPEPINDAVETYVNDDLKCYDGIFPWVEWAPVFPSGVVGLRDRGTPLFDTAKATAKSYAMISMGWDPLPIVLARLGLRDELSRILSLWPDRWQWYVNGFGYYGPSNKPSDSAQGSPLQTAMVRDAAKDAQFPSPTWPFRHMGMEAMSVLACAMNESLLQSHDGVIRVAPAAPRRGRARFTLHAMGGFVVSSEIEQGVPRWIHVAARSANTCRIENPWPEAYLFRKGAAPVALQAGIDEIALQENETVLLGPTKQLRDQWTVEKVEYAPNAKPKVHSKGRASLGLPQMY